MAGVTMKQTAEYEKNSDSENVSTSMPHQASDEMLDILFRKARSHNAWIDKPVSDDLLCRLYEAHMCDQGWPTHTGKTPGCKHQSIDRADISGTEKVGGKRWHRAETTAVTQQDDEGENRQRSEVVNLRKQKEDDGLRQHHHLKYAGSADEIRTPGPQKPTGTVGNRNDSNQTGGHHDGNMSRFLRQWRGLGNDGNARQRVKR